MNSLSLALAHTEELRDALAAEGLAAESERVWIRTIDVDELNLRAVKRGDFNRRIARMQEELATILREVAGDLGVPAVTLDALHGTGLPEGRRLAALLQETRTLAVALSQLDQINRLLGQRALSYVRAHLAVICPKPSAYDRRGSGAPDPRTSTVRRVL